MRSIFFFNLNIFHITTALTHCLQSCQIVLFWQKRTHAMKYPFNNEITDLSDTDHVVNGLIQTNPSLDGVNIHFNLLALSALSYNHKVVLRNITIISRPACMSHNCFRYHDLDSLKLKVLMPYEGIYT